MRRLGMFFLCLAVSVTAIAQRRRTVASGGGTTTTPVTPATPAPQAGASLAGLTATQIAAFNAGRNIFMRVETAATGLGPVYNDDSCSACTSRLGDSCIDSNSLKDLPSYQNSPF